MYEIKRHVYPEVLIQFPDSCETREEKGGADLSDGSVAYYYACEERYQSRWTVWGGFRAGNGFALGVVRSPLLLEPNEPTTHT